MKREADHSYETVEKLREGPIAMAKDHELDAFVTNNDRMVDPRLPLRQLDQITYPGKDHPAAIEVRSGMLERKSKYLKSYTPGWYVPSKLFRCLYTNAQQVCPLSYTSTRIQVCGSYQLSITHHVSVPARAKAGYSFRAWLKFAQVHAQRTPDRHNA